MPISVDKFENWFIIKELSGFIWSVARRLGGMRDGCCRVEKPDITSVGQIAVTRVRETRKIFMPITCLRGLSVAKMHGEAISSS